MFGDSPHPDPASHSNQSVELQLKSSNWFPQNVRH